MAILARERLFKWEGMNLCNSHWEAWYRTGSCFLNPEEINLTHSCNVGFLPRWLNRNCLRHSPSSGLTAPGKPSPNASLLIVCVRFKFAAKKQSELQLFRHIREMITSASMPARCKLRMHQKVETNQPRFSHYSFEMIDSRSESLARIVQKT